MLLTNKNVESLCKKTGSLRASIYIPTHPKSSTQTINGDITRFKNALSQIKNDINYHERELDKTLTALAALVDDVEFWKYQDVGLAIFADADGYEYMHLPYEVVESVYLKDRFVVSPLLIMLSVGAGFYLLDVNFTNPRLLYGNSFGLVEVNKKNMPESEEAESGRDEGFRKQVQQRARGTGFHGHSEEGAMDEAERRYLKKIADAVNAYLSDEDKPLIVMGTSSRVGNIRPELKYGNVVSTPLIGNKQEYNEAELFAKSASLVAELKAQSIDERMSVFEGAAMSDKLVSTQEIREALAAGRVSTLFVPAYRVTQDSVRPGNDRVAILQLPADIWDLEELIVGILNQGGDIVAVEIGANKEFDGIKALTRF